MNWDLSRIYKGFDDEAFARDMTDMKDGIERALAEIASFGHGDERSELKSLITNMNGILQLSQTLGNMIFLTLSVNSEDEDALSKRDKYEKLEVELTKLDSAAARYVGDIKNLDEIIKGEPLLEEHAYVLEKWQSQANHTIAPEIESAVLDMQLTGGTAWNQLRDSLDASHTVIYKLDGEEKTITLSEARAYAYSDDQRVRKAAFEAEIASYPKIEKPMAACLNGIKGEALTLIKFKNYPSVLDWSIDQAKITRPILEAMISAINKSLPTFRRYLKLKAKALGHDGGIPFYDLFAPLGDAGEVYSLEKAREILETVLGGFSPDMGKMVSRAFDERLIDAFPRPGKQGGAFCSSVYPIKRSYVLSNFDGSLGSVSTLAHELGHAYHDTQLFKNSILNNDIPMTLAETASIFNETLLTGELIKSSTPSQKLLILDQELTDATQVIVDILSRFLFEDEVFNLRKDSVLSPARLCEIMLESQKKTYADGLSEYHPYMWACKSHYYSPDIHYYNFPYAFGLLFGKGIYAIYQKEGKSFNERYAKLLRFTALSDAKTVASSIGIDLEREEFWLNSLDVIASGVNAMESIL